MDPSHHELLAQVGSLYYEQELTQNEIADRLGLSRVKVYRLLREARSAGVVRIQVDWPIQRDPALESALRQSFDLTDALVLQRGQIDTGAAVGQLGQLAARYLEGLIQPGATIALCPGRSSYALVQAMQPDVSRSVRVVQAIGHLPEALLEYDAALVARMLAQKLGGDVIYLSSPLMADTPTAAKVLRAQRDIARALEAARTADLAIVGIGDLDPASSGFARTGLLSAAELDSLRAGGAVGDIAWRIFDTHGQLDPCDFNQRVIGISLSELAQVPLTLALAVGARKSAAVRAALHTGAVKVLCTDDRMAAALLR